MTFGLSLQAFTVLHVVISMLAIFSGFIVVGGMFSNARLAGWTAIFLILTILTSATGFLFPIGPVTPALIVGVVASLILIVALVALYKYRLAGRWRAIYVTAAIVSLYLNVFVLIAQSFQSRSASAIREHQSSQSADQEPARAESGRCPRASSFWAGWRRGASIRTAS